VVREGLGVGGEMTQALFAHMNNNKNFFKNPVPQKQKRRKERKN
jgi:hypothetical protein